jgi:hypothetical protein
MYIPVEWLWIIGFVLLLIICGIHDDANRKIERLRAVLRKIAAEADRGSANNDELRDWLWAIRSKAREALGGE